LLALLTEMARNRVHDHVRYQQADCRDHRRVEKGGPALESVAGRQETPSVVVANRELLEQVRELLSEEERYLVDQRDLGRSWDDLAAELGISAAAARMQRKRALQRVTQQLGMEEVHD